MENALMPTEAGVNVRQEFGVTEIARQGEMQQAALMAQQKALIEARFVVAYRNRRQWQEIRINVNRLCDDPDFAAEALYVKPIAATPRDWSKMSKREQLQSAPETWPQGFSIRFVETVLFECGNFDAPAVVIWEDEQKRITHVSVIDLERNSAYHRTVVTEKTVERKKLADGQEAVATRTNSWGDTIYLVAATTDQVALSEASGVSKAIRTLGERLLRPDLKREWRMRCEKAIMDKAAKDPEGEKKKILDSFAEKGVMPSAVETYLEKPIAGAQPADILELRKIYQALSSGECIWKDVMEAKFGTEDERSKPAEALRAKLDKVRAAAAQPKPTPEAKTSEEAKSPSPETAANAFVEYIRVEGIPVVNRYPDNPKNGDCVYIAKSDKGDVAPNQRPEQFNAAAPGWFPLETEDEPEHQQTKRDSARPKTSTITREV